jgi:hypothetical protein
MMQQLQSTKNFGSGNVVDCESAMVGDVVLALALE